VRRRPGPQVERASEFAEKKRGPAWHGRRSKATMTFTGQIGAQGRGGSPVMVIGNRGVIRNAHGGAGPFDLVVKFNARFLDRVPAQGTLSFFSFSGDSNRQTQRHSALFKASSRQNGFGRASGYSLRASKNNLLSPGGGRRRLLKICINMGA